MAIFTNTSELVILSADMMSILAAGYIAMAVTQSLSGVMRGAGDTVTPMWISMVTTVAIRVPLAYGIAWATRTPELPQGRVSVHLDLPVDLLGAGSGAHRLLLPPGKMEEENSVGGGPGAGGLSPGDGCRSPGAVHLQPVCDGLPAHEYQFRHHHPPGTAGAGQAGQEPGPLPAVPGNHRGDEGNRAGRNRELGVGD